MYKRNNDIKGMCGSETTKSIVSVRRDHHKHWEELMDRLGGRDGLPPHPDRAQSRFRLGDLLQIFIILIFAGYIVTLTNIARAQVSFDTFDANVGAEIQRQLDKPTPMPAPKPSYVPVPTYVPVPVPSTKPAPVKINQEEMDKAIDKSVKKAFEEKVEPVQRLNQEYETIMKNQTEIDNTKKKIDNIKEELKNAKNREQLKEMKQKKKELQEKLENLQKANQDAKERAKKIKNKM